MALTDEQAAELKTKNGDELRSVEAPDGSVCAFRPPRRSEYNRWIDKSTGSRSESAMELAQSCLIYPERAGFIAMLDKYPAMLLGKGGFVDAILDMAGATDEGAIIKKL